LKKSELKCFDKFIETYKSRQKEILNYFKGRSTGGFVEGFNNKIKVLKRRCYGIFDAKTLYKRLVLDLTGYAVYRRNTGFVLSGEN